MRKKKYAVFKTAIMLLTILSLVIVANAGYNTIEKDSQNNLTSKDGLISNFYAEITFYLYEGEGCECQPVRFAPIVVQGLDTSHSASGETDSYGFLLLELEFDATYRVTIESDVFETVIMDFNVIDDQTLTFHLQEEEVSISSISFLQKITRLFNLPKN